MTTPRLSEPLRGMARAKLVALLMILVVLEAAGGWGLYLNNHAAGAATGTPVANASREPVHYAITASPVLLLARHSATFAVHLAALANQHVVFRIVYPDGSTVSQPARADVSGFASATVLLRYVTLHQQEPISVEVLQAGRVAAVTSFTVLLPATP